MSTEPTKNEPGTDDLAASIPEQYVPVLTNITVVVEIDLDHPGAGDAELVRLNLGDADLLDVAFDSRMRWIAQSGCKQLQIVTSNPAHLPFFLNRVREEAQKYYDMRVRQTEERAKREF